MEKENHSESNQFMPIHQTGEEFLKELMEIPPDYSRAGQSFVTFSPMRGNAMKNISEKKLNEISMEENIQAMMKRTGLTREQIERMLADPF